MVSPFQILLIFSDNQLQISTTDAKKPSGKRFSPYGCTLQIRHTQSENIPRIRMDRQDEQTAKPYQSTHCRRTTYRRSRQKNNALTKGIRGQKYHRRAHENRRTCDDRRVSERMHPPQSGKSTEKANQQTRCPSALTAIRRLSKTARARLKKHFGRATAGHFLFYNQIMLLSRENGAFFAECKKFILRDWTRHAQSVIIKGEDSL